MLVYKMYQTEEQDNLLEELKEKNSNVKFIETNNKQACFNAPSLAIFARYWTTVKSIVRVRLSNNLTTYVSIDDCMACYNKVIPINDWSDIISFDDSLKEYFISLELDQLADQVKNLVLENKMLSDKLDQYNTFDIFLTAIEDELYTLQDKELNTRYDIDIDIGTQKLTFLKDKSYKHVGKPTAYMEEGTFISYREERTKERYIQTAYDTMLAWLTLQWYKLADISHMEREEYLQEQAIANW